jgi:hypothetical protein
MFVDMDDGLPLFEDISSPLPADVATAAGEKAGDGVPAEVVYPAFLPQLSHERINPGEACAAPFPALESLFGL